MSDLAPIFTFTVTQALLSALASVICAIPLSEAILRRGGTLRGLFSIIFLLPFFMPQLVVLSGLFALFGRSGIFAALGLPAPPLFGLFGIVLAHAILNIPLVTRLLLTGWQAVSADEMNLARSLDDKGRALGVIRRAVWREVLPYGFALVCLYCLLSFTIPLVLGGGPKSSTLELAIYQAIRFDFDLERAAMIGILQIILGLTVFFAVKSFEPAQHTGRYANTPYAGTLPTGGAFSGRMTDFAVLGAGLLLLLTPLLLAIIEGIGGFPKLVALLSPRGFWAPIAISLAMALAAASLALGVSILLISLRLSGAAFITAALSPIALTAFLILGLRYFANPFDFGLPIVIAMQALASLPLTVLILRQGLRRITIEHRHLMATLSMPLFARLGLVYLPTLRNSLLQAFFLVAALSIGDLSVLPLVAPPDFENLPMLLFRLMARYRFDEAAAIALIMTLLIALLLMAGRLLEKNHA